MELVQIKNVLRSLRLPGVVENLETRLQEAVNNKLGYLEFLSLIIQDERSQRDNNQVKKCLRRANLGMEKTFEGFDFSFNENAIPRKIISDLRTCEFIGRGKNIVFAGPPGIGKTHIAKAICHEACRRKKHVLFIKINKLFRTLLTTVPENKFENFFKRIVNVDLLVLDDFAFRQLDAKEVEMLYSVIDDRQGLKSTIITSNRPTEDWINIFPDPVMGGAILDRLVSDAIKIIVKNAKSYRKEGQISLEKRII